jgi:hypothetical protein
VERGIFFFFFGIFSIDTPSPRWYNSKRNTQPILSTKRKPSILRVESVWMVVGFNAVPALLAFVAAAPKTIHPKLGRTVPVFWRDFTATLLAKNFGFHAGDNAVGGGGEVVGGGVAHAGSIPDPAPPVKGSGTDFYF